jgi:hypothetical protein
MTPALIATFATESELKAAARSLHEDGWRILDIHAPAEIALPEGLAVPRTGSVKVTALLAALLAFAAIMTLQLWTKDVAYPFNSGGRTDNAWPALILPALEAAALAAGVTALLRFMTLAGLPALSHPVFGSRLHGAVANGFFALVIARDPQPSDPHARLIGLAAVEIEEIDL